MRMQVALCAVCVGVVLGGVATGAVAQQAGDDQASRFNIHPVSLAQDTTARPTTPEEQKEQLPAASLLPPEPNETEDEQALLYPFRFSITYYLYSDYIFRGTNFSEFPGEGDEDLNHQMTTELAVDVAGLFGREAGSLGEFAFATFFEWYAGQDMLDPSNGGQNLQEVDYTLSWSYELKPLHTTVTPGYCFYVFPEDTAINTDEWFVRLDHNDAWMWKWLWPDNEDGVLNPYVMYAHTVKYAAGAKWWELGFSHPFELVDGLTLTPSVTLAWQGDYYERMTRQGSEYASLAYTQYGLNLEYDLAKGLKLKPHCGSIPLSTFIYYNEATQGMERNGYADDVLFGGVSIGWSI